MRSQLDLQNIFLAITPNVYFQPPETYKMVYPCIRYQRNKINSKYSNNKMYTNTVGYMVTVIDPNPNSLILEKLLRLPLCIFDRHYTQENLNHDVYNLYY